MKGIEVGLMGARKLVIFRNLISQQDVHIMFKVVLLANIMIFMKMFMRALSKAQVK